MARPPTLTLLTAIAVVPACSDGPADPGPLPAALAVVSGTDQRQFPTAEVFDRPGVQLVDADGNEVRRSGWLVTWTVVAGGGSVQAFDDTTSERGRADAAWRLGPDPGPNVLRAASAELGSVELTAEAVSPGPIVFVSGRSGVIGNDFEGYPGDLYVMEEDGSNVLPLFPPGTTIQYLTDPVWAPDGESILFQRAAGRPAGGVPGLLPLGLFSIRFHQLDEMQVPAAGLPFWVSYFFEPAWVAGGDRIVTYFDPDSLRNLPPEVQPFQLHLMSSAGLNPVAVPSPADVSRAPDWTPVGDRIVFVCETGPAVEVCVMDSAGGNFVQLTDTPEHEGDPRWSPDGARIAFVRDAVQGGGVWLMDADGANQRPLMGGRITSPAWSPDGNALLVTLSAGDRQDIYRVDAATGAAVNLTDTPFRDRDPAWRR